jgi:acyl-CoA synthetase (AMP-forming)/AMP-acid ligase II
MPNGTEWVLSAAAAGRVGACLVTLSTLLRPPELLAELRTAAVTHLIAARESRGRLYLEELEEVAPDIAAITAEGRRHPVLPSLRKVWSFEDLPGPAVDQALVAALGEVVRPADDLVILFTPGSRAAPKGVIHTHGNSIRATVAELACRRVGPDEHLYVPMPFFGTGGFAGGLMTALVAGATLLTEASPGPEETLTLLERRAPGPKAGANLLGITESFGPYCGDGLGADSPLSKDGSCGRPFEGIEVRIVDPATRIEVPSGSVGEISLRGPNMMRAICGRRREETFDEEGFYPTGDLGALDADGYLWYHGRLDDMIKPQGATVYPAEVPAASRER